MQDVGGNVDVGIALSGAPDTKKIGKSDRSFGKRLLLFAGHCKVIGFTSRRNPNSEYHLQNLVPLGQMHAIERSRAEVKMGCLKSFGKHIAARDPDRQSAEIHIRLGLINRFNALGTAEIVCVS